jgi:hypothetical protein
MLMLVGKSLVLLSGVPFVPFRKAESCLEGGNLSNEFLLMFFGFTEKLAGGSAVGGGSVVGASAGENDSLTPATVSFDVAFLVGHCTHGVPYGGRVIWSLTK